MRYRYARDAFYGKITFIINLCKTDMNLIYSFNTNVTGNTFTKPFKQLHIIHLLFLAVAITVSSVSIAGTKTTGGIKETEVTYHNQDNKGVKGYLAVPEGRGKKPAIILIHEWWGLNDEIRDKARKYAKDGYIALAVDLYNGESTTKPKDARRLAGSVGKNKEDAFDNLRAALAYLKKHKNVDKNRLASVGWCFGGGWSYQVAKNDLGTRASVIYYGRFNPADDLSQMRAKILGHFAEKDRGIKVDDVRQFQASLKTQSGDHEIFIYPNTGHGFTNSNSAVYDAAATSQAYDRTLEFLKKHL